MVNGIRLALAVPLGSHYFEEQLGGIREAMHFPPSPKAGNGCHRDLVL